MNQVIAVIATLIAGGCCLPARHSRRSTFSNDIGSQQEIIVRVPLVEEMRLSETELGGVCANSSGNRKFMGKMGLFKLSGEGAATCNDGSNAGYYLFRQPESTKWVIYLEGGWYCADEATCGFRPRELVSSRNWSICKQGSGIFSSDPAENPHLWNANMVYVPYCSSDLWTGTVRNQRLGNVVFDFMGSKIIDQVVQRLIHNHGMQDAWTVLFAGSSAGGTGVFMNIDRVQGHLTTAGSSAIVRGVVDSAWYMVRPEMDQDSDCPNARHCSAVAIAKMGVSLWQANIPSGCASEHMNVRTTTLNSDQSRDDRWKCLFGEVIYPHINGDVFIVQWLFDEVQLQSDQIDLPPTRQSRNPFLNYIQNHHNEMNSSFENVSGVFATSCVAHTVIHNSDWDRFVGSGVSLPDAIQCWDLKLDASSRHRRNPDVETPDEPTTIYVNGQYYYYSTYEDAQGNAEFASSEIDADEYGQEYSSEDPRPAEAVTRTVDVSTCTHRVVDSCQLPMCNPTCPELYHPRTFRRITREELIETLIDIGKEATKYGMESQELINMLNAAG